MFDSFESKDYNNVRICVCIIVLTQKVSKNFDVCPPVRFWFYLVGGAILYKILLLPSAPFYLSTSSIRFTEYIPYDIDLRSL